MTEPSEQANRPQPGRSHAVSALNALDLAIASQQVEEEITTLLCALLPLLDRVESLCRGLDSQPDDVVAQRAETLALLPELADKAIEQIDLCRFGAVGESVDRTRHEVVDTVVDAQRPAGTVAEVVESGWSYQGRPLRFAKVVATVKPPKEV